MTSFSRAPRGETSTLLWRRAAAMRILPSPGHTATFSRSPTVRNEVACEAKRTRQSYNKFLLVKIVTYLESDLYILHESRINKKERVKDLLKYNYNINPQLCPRVLDVKVIL
jgi:hypothetical protein